MTRKILINAQDPDVSRIAAVVDNKLEQFHIETRAKQVTHNPIESFLYADRASFQTVL